MLIYQQKHEAAPETTKNNFQLELFIKNIRNLI